METAVPERSPALALGNGDSARARLVNTRRGTSIDKSLLPAARLECLETLREAAREAVGRDTYGADGVSGVSERVDWKTDEFWNEWIEEKNPKDPVEERISEEISDTISLIESRGGFEGLGAGELWDFVTFIGESIRSRHASQQKQEDENAPTPEVATPEYGVKGTVRPFTGQILLRHAIDALQELGVLDSIIELDFERAPLEELDAWELAREARETARVCGCCGRELTPKESAYFGAEVYVGMWPLYWDRVSKPRICKPRYERTVLCESCAPEWLSPERGGVITQLCAHCERPMISRLQLSQLRRTFCSESCRQTYHNGLRKEKRAEERRKVCEVCGEEFIATRRDAKTCSDACKQKAHRQRKRR
jgi:hypothetical protein